jgi:polysaccharide export outer membrane protein
MHRFLFTVMMAGVAGAQTQSPSPPGHATPYSDAGGANLPVQRIGPNDLLSISVYDAPEFTRMVRVSAEGDLILPLMGKPVKAAGLLPSELEPLIAHALRDQDLLNEATVIVTIADYNSRPIIVTGAVHAPLIFQAVGTVRLVDAITRAGGVSAEAGNEVDIVSPDGAVRRIPLKPLLDSTSPELNVGLRGGEEVRIPDAGKIYVLGNVKSSGAFPIQDEADATVLKFLALAGGLSSTAPKQAFVVRVDSGSQIRRELEIPLKDIVERKSPDMPLLAHDILYIPENKRHEMQLSLERIIGLAAGGAVLVNVAK